MTNLVLDQKCTRCEGGAHDVIDQQREGFVTLWCVYCGMRKDIPERKLPKRVGEQSPETGEVFRFKFGRFKGLTLEETDGQANGRQYLEWMASNNEKIGGQIGEYLAQTT